MTAAEYLTRVEAAAAAATEGPWMATADQHPYRGRFVQVEPVSGSRSICDVTDANKADAAFIALSRDAVPRMAAALRAAIKVCEEPWTARDGISEYRVVDAADVLAAITAALAQSDAAVQTVADGMGGAR